MSWQDDEVVVGGWQADPVVDKYEKQAKADSPGQNIMAATGGVLYAPYLGVKSALGKAEPGEVQDWKQSMAGLWSTPGGKLGTVLGGVAAMVPAAFIPGANTAVGAGFTGAAYGAVQPAESWKERGLNTAIGGALGGGSQAGLNAVGGALANRAASKATELAAQKVQNTARDSTVRAAQEAGYVLPPTHVKPNLINSLTEGASGKLKTQQLAAVRNESVTTDLAKRAIGIPDEIPLTKESIKGVRDAAGEIYGYVSGVGRVPADRELARDMAGVVGKYKSVVDDFPSRANSEVDALLKDLQKGEFGSESLVEVVKQLRHDGFANIKSLDPKTKTLGRVQLGAQEALENMLERHLHNIGAGEMADVFKNARVLIAKTHTVENAFEESTGKVVASKLARDLAKGRPLSGELKTIAKTAQAFPKATQNVNSAMPVISPLDVMAGIISGASGGGVAGGAALAGRPLLREALLSKPWQKSLAPNYSQGLISRRLPELLESDYLGLLGASQVPAFTGRP